MRIAPFHGVTGVAWDEPGEHSTIPPRPVGGGNIDCKELVAGSTLYLPVAVPGALLSVGDEITWCRGDKELVELAELLGAPVAGEAGSLGYWSKPFPTKRSSRSRIRSIGTAMA